MYEFQDYFAEIVQHDEHKRNAEDCVDYRYQLSGKSLAGDMTVTCSIRDSLSEEMAVLNDAEMRSNNYRSS